MRDDPKFVRDSNSNLKLLTFQLSNVRELETIKYAYGSWLIYDWKVYTYWCEKLSSYGEWLQWALRLQVEYAFFHLFICSTVGSLDQLYVETRRKICYTSLLLLDLLATTFLWLSAGTWTDDMVAGTFISSDHQNAGTACSCTRFPSTGPIEPASDGMNGLPCEQQTHSCPQHHHTNCYSLMLLVVSSKTFITFVT